MQRTQEETTALLQELYAVKSLLDWAGASIDRWRFTDDDAHPTLAVASAGTERLLKIAYGVAATADGGDWPGGVIRSFGHRIADLDTACRQLIRERIARATHQPVVERCLATVQQNPWIDDWLQLLTAYADQGRYENLNVLAGAEPKATPRALLQDMEGRILNWASDPAGTQALWRHRNETIKSALRQWRDLYAYAFLHGVVDPNPDVKGYGYAFKSDQTSESRRRG